MWGFTFFLLLFLTTFVYGQVHPVFDQLETEDTFSGAIPIPIYIDFAGEVSFPSRTQGNVNFNPAIHVGISKSRSRYIMAAEGKALSFQEQNKNLGHVEVRRKRYEYGAGIQNLVRDARTSVGLVPFKGAREIMKYVLEPGQEHTPDLTLPRDLIAIHEWGVGTEGSFQRYGGLQAAFGVGVSFVNFVGVSVLIQNIWTLKIKKISSKKLFVSFNEEDSNRRLINIGPIVAHYSFSQFKSKNLVFGVTLDLNDNLHNELYKKLLLGRLDEVQRSLPFEIQSLSWQGNEHYGYVGIPYLLGRNGQNAHYDVTERDGSESELDIKLTRNLGFLPLRSHQKVAYQTDEALILYWHTEMNRARGKNVDKNYLRYGRAIGVKGFEEKISQVTYFGSTLGQLGLEFKRSELETLAKSDDGLIEKYLLERCQLLELPCRKPKHLARIMASYQFAITQPWEQLRADMGYLMLKDPALIYAAIKAIGVRKSAYFRFMSETFQSLEGQAIVDI